MGAQLSLRHRVWRASFTLQHNNIWRECGSHSACVVSDGGTMAFMHSVHKCTHCYLTLLLLWCSRRAQEACRGGKRGPSLHASHGQLQHGGRRWTRQPATDQA